MASPLSTPTNPSPPSSHYFQWLQKIRTPSVVSNLSISGIRYLNFRMKTPINAEFLGILPGTSELLLIEPLIEQSRSDAAFFVQLIDLIANRFLLV